MSTALRLDIDEIEIPPGEDELPYSFGPPMDSDVHRMNINSLVDSGAEHFEDRPDVYIAGDMAVYFNLQQTKKNDFLGPDVFVVTGTVKRMRKSWVVWGEGRTPDIVIEITSPTTETNDRGNKMLIYATVLRVPEYYIYNPANGRLDGYVLNGGRYEPVLPSPNGEIRSTILPVGLRVVPRVCDGGTFHWLRWTDAQGELIPLPRERAANAEERAASAEERAESAEERAENAEERAESAEERAESAEAAAEEERHKAELAASQAADARARAETLAAEAAAAKEHAEAATTELARLAARLRALGIDPDA